MIRKGLLVPALAAGALIGATPAQASVQLAAVSGIVNQLHDNSSFSANNMQFTVCQNGSCQTMFTGLTGLRNMGGLGGVNSWANTGQYAGSGGAFDNYRFTYSAVGSFFGNPAPQQQQSFAQNMPIPEPATWAMMILGFGFVGMAMRRRAKDVSFA